MGGIVGTPLYAVQLRQSRSRKKKVGREPFKKCRRGEGGPPADVLRLWEMAVLWEEGEREREEEGEERKKQWLVVVIVSSPIFPLGDKNKFSSLILLLAELREGRTYV